MPHPSPRHREAPPPRRLAAVGGAALVTVVTVAGALGFGPGAAADETARLPHPSSHTSPGGRQPTGPLDASARTGGSWLTIDRPDASSESPDASSGGAGDEQPTAPALPRNSGSGKRIVFDMSDQRVWLVDGPGRVARTYPVSGSLHNNLDAGTYEVYSRSLHAVSFDGNHTMRYMVRFTQGATAAIGFHDIPRRPDGSLVERRSELGTAQSAGCIRQWEPDAKALWRFAPVGTTVVVLD